MDGASIADVAYQHELRSEQAARDLEQAAEREFLERATANGVGALVAGFQPINDWKEARNHVDRGERYRQTLTAIYRYVDELDMKLLEGELHEPEDKTRRLEEQLLASQVIDEVKALIARMYIGGR